MKIAYLVNQYPRPSQTFIRREIHALEALGMVVHRYSVRPFSAEVVDDADKAEERKTDVLLSAPALLVATILTLVRHPVLFVRALQLTLRLAMRSDRGRLKHAAYLAEACLLRRWMVRDRIEHVHAHFGTNSTTVAMLARVLGGPPYSFTCHGPEEFDRPESLSLGEKVAHSAFAVAISSFARSQLYRWTDAVHWPRIHIVRCGVDRAFLSGLPDGSPPTVPRLVCVGRLSEQKGQLLLLAAAATLAAEGIDFEILLVGDGPMRGQIESTIARLGLADRVRIAGWMDNRQVREQILASRALLLPSFAEGLPVVIMEAFALCRPVISTYIAAIPELVEPGVSGWLVPPGDHERLLDAMRTALTCSTDQLQKMGRTGAASVAMRHDAAKEAAVLAGLFTGTAVRSVASRAAPAQSPHPV